ncbi:hypothetical protein ABK040_007375 [Willaertia magna]
MQLINFKKLLSEKFPLLKDTDRIKFISHGDEHEIIVLNNNEVYGKGNNEVGQLGLSSQECYPDAEEFTKLKVEHVGNIKYATCGDYSIVIVNDKNEVFNSGYFSGKFGPFGFTKVLDLNHYNINNFKFIRANSRAIFIVCNDGVYAMGSNKEGILGLVDNLGVIEELTKISDKNVADLKLGCSHTVLLDQYGVLFVTGYNGFGELGLNDKIQRNAFTRVDLPFKVELISCGQRCTTILNQYGEVYVTGSNQNGQLGVGDNVPRYTFTKIDLKEKVKYILCEFKFNMILTENNNLFVSGRNYQECLGIPEEFCKEEHFVPYLDVFTKVDLEINDNLRTKDKFIYPILFCQKIYCVTSDKKLDHFSDCVFYKDKTMDLGLNCFSNLKRNMLVDIKINIQH